MLPGNAGKTAKEGDEKSKAGKSAAESAGDMILQKEVRLFGKVHIKLASKLLRPAQMRMEFRSLKLQQSQATKIANSSLPRQLFLPEHHQPVEPKMRSPQIQSKRSGQVHTEAESNFNPKQTT